MTTHEQPAKNPTVRGLGCVGCPPLGATHDNPRTQAIVFDVVGDPKGDPRPRATVVGFGKGARAKVYVPDTAKRWKHDVRAAAVRAIQEAGGWRIVSPGVAVSVFLAFRIGRPKSHFRTGRNAGILRDRAPRFHTGRPDKDNLEKAVLDALGEFDGERRLFWSDDSQAVDGRTSKRWTRPGEEPGVAVAIIEL